MKNNLIFTMKAEQELSAIRGEQTLVKQPTNHPLITHLSPTSGSHLAAIRKYAAMVVLMLFVGVGQAWGGNYHVVGVALTNSNDYDVYVNVKRQDNWGWYSWKMSKAEISFEGKKLYIAQYQNSDANDYYNNFQFLLKEGDSQKDYTETYAGSGESGSTYANKIYNYDGSTWYSVVTVETSARFYFDATGWTSASDKYKLVVGHANYQRYSTISPIEHTKLYYGSSGDRWTDAMGIGVVGNTTASDGENWLTNVSSAASEYTGFKNYGLTATSSGNAYLMVNAGSAGEEPTMSYNDLHTTLLNSTQTVKYALSTNGGTPTVMSSGTTPAKITMSSYKFVSDTYNSVSSETPTALSAGGTTYTRDFTAARTATTTLTVSEIVTGYQFDGWYDAANGGTQLSSSTTYTYYPTSATTVYARFSEKMFTVTFASGGNGTVSTPSSTSATVGQVTGIAVNVTPNDGYEFNTWNIASGAGSFASALTIANNTFYPSEDATIQANFRSTATNSLTVAAGAHVTTVSGSQDPVTLGNKYAISATAFETGYEFFNWTASPEANGTFDDENSASTNVTVNNGSVTVTANAREIMHTVSITNGTGSSSVGIATKATATAEAAATGKKFKQWNITGTYTFQDATTLTSREIHFTATTNVSLTAEYEDRDFVKVYFLNSGNWEKVYAYAWENGASPANNNGAFPGVEVTDNTETVNCVTYNYYKYYTDNNGEGDDQTDAAYNWDKIIFANSSEATENGTNKTNDLTISNGKYYLLRTDAEVSGYTKAQDWYVKGSFPEHSWDENYPIDFSSSSCGVTGSVLVEGLTANNSYSFKIYRRSTNQYFKYTGGADASYDADKSISTDLGQALVLREYNNNNNTVQTASTSYRFTLDITSTSNPVLTVAPGTDADYSATLAINGHGSVSPSAGAITLHQYTPTTITATPEPGYRFVNWTVTGSATVAEPSNASTTVTATADGATITANFSNEGFIYFDHSAVNGVWGSNIYISFFSNAFDWTGSDGGLKQTNIIGTSKDIAMTRIPNTQIYYADISGKTTGRFFAITDKRFDNQDTYWSAAAVARGDYDGSTGNNMFVVENYVEKSKNSVGYYYGYWMQYNTTAPGIELVIRSQGSGNPEITGSPFTFTTTAAGKREFTTTASLDAATYYIELRGDNKSDGTNKIFYKNSGSMTADNCTGWAFVERDTRGSITTTAAGKYKFTLSCSDKLYLTAEYPLTNDDYRLVYSGPINTESDAVHVHPSEFVRHLSAKGEKDDTISFFIPSSTKTWSLQLQKCTDASANPPTWANEGSPMTSATSGFPTSAGIYMFKVHQNHDGTTNTVTVTNIGKYTGQYYIRTDAADGGWEAYKQVADNIMAYSYYSKTHSGYDYNHCHWTSTNGNVKFTIANDYSTTITDTVVKDSYVTHAEGNLPYEASVRFMYNSETNVISRAYLNGSNEGETEYLSLRAMNDSIRINDSTSIEKISPESSENHLKLQDMGNWTYQKDIQVREGTHYRLISNYRFGGVDHLQYFKGSEGDWKPTNTELLLGGDEDEYLTLRIVYNYKTNHLLAAWLVPESGNSRAIALETNVMILQQNQDTARQITFANSTDKMTEIDTVYSTVHLTKDFMQNTNGQDNSEAARKFFYVSFPYDVDLSDVFGSVGEYGVDWAIQWYDGKKRAREGFWADSEPNWKFFETAKGSTLRAYEGYVLTLNLNKFLDDSKWKYGVTDIYLYFPSKDKIGTIQNVASKEVRVMPLGETAEDYTCTINRATPDGDRTLKDSHWHCIGSPSFARNNTTSWNTHDGTPEEWKAESLPFLYEWNSATNVMAPVAAGGTYKFKPLTAYLVQYEGPTITWTNVVTPASSVARRAPEKPDKETTFTLSLLRGEEKMDQTFVRISENEAVTSGFEFGQDLCKEFQKGANIYTIVENTELAGNSLPLETEKTTIVPVGVRITAAGEYTFAMPEGTNGTGVVLIDNIAGTRTNLALGDYTVTLGAGTTDGRFVLEISPIAQTPTGNLTPTLSQGEGEKVRKVMVDGVLYIVKDGKAYDARGTRVK